MKSNLRMLAKKKKQLTKVVKHTLRFREKDIHIWKAIKDGSKRVETRARTVKFQKLHIGDHVVFVYKDKRFEKEITNIKLFKTIDSLVEVYKPKIIIPGVEHVNDLKKVYASFPGYVEKIKKFGLVAIELK